MNKKTVYFGAGWFNKDQETAYNDAYQALCQNDTVDVERSYFPRQNQFHGLEVADRPELLTDREWSTGTYRGDINGIKTRDMVLAVYLPQDEDPGLAMEIGWAAATGKHVLMVIPDEYYGEPINLMTWGGSDNVIRMSELAEYDFNTPKFDFYQGGVY